MSGYYNSVEKNERGEEMKQWIIVALVAILLGAQCICLSAATMRADERIVVPLEDTPKVELYITSWCPYSKKAVNFFQSRGIPFVSYDIEKDESAAQRKNRLDSKSGVPFLCSMGKKSTATQRKPTRVQSTPNEDPANAE